MTMDTPILECRGIVKTFGAAQVLKSVDLALFPGRVTGLIGENGAGKSTLARIIAGVYKPTAGEILFDGQQVHFANANEALQRKIVTVHQDINLVGSMTVAENITLNNEPTGFVTVVDRADERRSVEALLAQFHVEARADQIVDTLPNDVRKMVQILKAVARDARVLLLDEPTSSLTNTEVTVVLNLIRTLAARGVAIVFISHYMSEILEVCDDITVLRDGARVLSVPRSQTDLGQIITAMLGGKPQSEDVRAEDNVDRTRAPLLTVRGLSGGDGLRSLDFDLWPGEVLGLTGLTGSGVSSVGKSLFGGDPAGDAERVELQGEPLKIRHPATAIRNSIALLASDRLRDGIIPDFNLVDNFALPILDTFSSLGVLKESNMIEVARENFRNLTVKASGPRALARQLSGGNQQKVLLARWLATKPKVLILDEPTIGVDIGAKHEIRNIIRSIAASGVGVILLTTEVEELERLCHRVIVLFRGSQVRQFTGTEIQKTDILSASVSGNP